MMQLYSRKRYFDADTYTGNAAHEIDHHEFFKEVLGVGYSADSAVSDMLSAMETAATQSGYVLLTVDIYYDNSGYLYHMFDVDYKFTDPSLAVQTTSIQNNVDQQMLFDPLTWAALITAVMPLLLAIIYYIMANSIMKDLTNIMYTPGDTSGGLSTSTVVKYGILLIAATYLLKALTGASEEIRRY
jgi:hypothetical protein